MIGTSDQASCLSKIFLKDSISRLATPSSDKMIAPQSFYLK